MPSNDRKEFYEACLAGISDGDLDVRLPQIRTSPQAFKASFEALGGEHDAKIANVSPAIDGHYYARIVGEPSRAQFAYAKKFLTMTITDLQRSLFPEHGRQDVHAGHPDGFNAPSP
jgi:hypothetical protein